MTRTHARTPNACAAGLAKGLIPWLLACAGCATQPPQSSVTQDRDETPARLEERLQRLADRYPIEERPLRDPTQIRAQIASLEERRQSLLLRYTAEHPAVVQLNRQIRLLQERLAAIEAAPGATAPPAP